MEAQFDPSEATNCWKFEILKIQDGGGRRLGKPKNRHIWAAVWLIFNEIWHSDAVMPSWAFQLSKFQKKNFKSKTAISRQRFHRFRVNLAWRRSSTLLSRATIKKLTFWKSKIVAAAILENRKSQYLSCGSTDFDKIWHNDAVRPFWHVWQLEIWNFHMAAFYFTLLELVLCDTIYL